MWYSVSFSTVAVICHLFFIFYLQLILVFSWLAIVLQAEFFTEELPFFSFSFSWKMSCHRCFQDNKEAFDHATCIFSTRHDPVVFLLNILLNVKKEWLCFCYCESTRGKCLACQFRNVYKDDEYEIYQNCFDLHFLAVFHQNM